MFMNVMLKNKKTGEKWFASLEEWNKSNKKAWECLDIIPANYCNIYNKKTGEIWLASRQEAQEALKRDDWSAEKPKTKKKADSDKDK